jgi:hypothetical protein
MSKIKIVADADGNIIVQSQNSPEYGYIRATQQAIEINNEGWLKSVTRSTLLKGKMEDLLLAGYTDQTELPGKIIVIESLFPFNTENPTKNLKIAGKTGVICRYDDQPIYRQTFYTTNDNAIDQLISHTNSEEIKDAMASQKLLVSLSQEKVNEEIDL